MLVVCDRLTWEEVNRDCPFLVGLMERAAIGLMNTAVAGPKNADSATLTLATGQTLAAEAGDEQAFNIDEAAGDEPGMAGVVFARRTGKAVGPGRTIANLNIASLTRRGINTQTLGAMLAGSSPPRRMLVCGNADTDTPGRRTALFALDAAGTAVGDLTLTRRTATKPFGLADDAAALARYAATTDADVFVVALGDAARVEAMRSRLGLDAYHAARQDALHNVDAFFLQLFAVQHLDAEQADVLLVSPCPPSTSAASVPSRKNALAPALLVSPAVHNLPANSEIWTQLTPVLALGPDFAPGLLSSPTTRTPGLVANVDITPTILRALGLAASTQMTGRVMQSLPLAGGAAARQASVLRLDFVTTLNARAQTLVAVPLSLLCFALAMAVVVAAGRSPYSQSAKRWTRRLLPGVLFTLNLPAGMLFATILVPPTLWEYGLRILACMAALTIFDYALARLLGVSPLAMCGLLILLLIVLDLLFGGHLLRESLLSAYPLSGIRYYGIGNEYLGAALGFALMGGFAEGLNAEEKRRGEAGTSRATKWIFGGWIALAFVMGWPGLGANAGSLIVTCAGFGVGAWMLSGRGFNSWVALICVLAGVVLSFALGALDAHFSGAQASHAGSVLNASAQGRGASYLAEIMARKAGMNLRLLVSPFFVAGAGLVALLTLLMRSLLGGDVRALFAARPRLRLLLPALTVTLLASLIFKDSGVVTAGFVAGVACLHILYYTAELKLTKA